MWAPTVQASAATWPMAVPEWNALTSGRPTEGPLLLACICAAWYNNPLPASLASAACGGVDPFGVPSLPPCPRSHGPWALGLDVLASAGPHTLPENPSLADPSGLQCIYIVLPMRTPTRSATTTTCPCPHGLRQLTSRMAALSQGVIPELWSLTAASRIRHSIVQVGCWTSTAVQPAPFLSCPGARRAGTRTVPR